ncbi:MAG: hypothetical protein RLZZ265_475, partial [Verrucomicrobiota bacterium]
MPPRAFSRPGSGEAELLRGRRLARLHFESSRFALTSYT